MIRKKGNTRDESNIRPRKQAHITRESHELEKRMGAYVSKPGTNACIASNHKVIACMFLSLQEEILVHSNQFVDEERIIELSLEQQEEKIIFFKSCQQEERHR